MDLWMVGFTTVVLKPKPLDLPLNPPAPSVFCIIKVSTRVISVFGCRADLDIRLFSFAPQRNA